VERRPVKAAARKRGTAAKRAFKAKSASKSRPADGAAALRQNLEQKARELDEALEQQVATADVLKVISGSTFDLQAVLEALVRSAAKLCHADRAAIRLLKDGALHHLASYGLTAQQRDFMIKTPVPAKPDRGSIGGRVLIEGKIVQIADSKADPDFRMTVRPAFANVRTVLGVPLLRGDTLIGLLVLSRKLVEPFTDKQISLVPNFAAQAVIAIENARLLNELRQRTSNLTDALEQQTATSEVLKVISASPTDANPVFETILESACQLCNSQLAAIFRFDGTLLHLAATKNWPAEAMESLAIRWPMPPNPHMTSGQVVLSKGVVIQEDTFADPNYDPDAAQAGGWRRMLGVPMLRSGEIVGVVVVTWREPGPILPRHVELLQTFAAQAVIAVENARLFNELRQSLEQQTATADVLRVISSSPGDLDPVFQAMLENATRICEAKFGTLYRLADGKFHLAAQFGSTPELMEAQRRRASFTPTPGTPLDRLMHTKQLSHSVDAATEPGRSLPARLGGARSTVAVPMIKDGKLVGAFAIYRQEVRPFTDKQIDLVTNFAAQAVIAIENTRLLSELRESLEQQTATSEVLRVISSSPGELEPVFQAMLDNAARLCEAPFGILLLRGEGLLKIVSRHVPPDVSTKVFEPGSELVFSDNVTHPLVRMVEAKEIVHIADLTKDPAYTAGNRRVVAFADDLGGRTALCVPMLKDNECVGGFVIFRRELRPFTEKQIALVQNFAAQAVIAIENARLLSELRQRTDDLSEALDQQTATSQVLRSIASSPGELEPVFNIILESANRLCEANYGTLYLREAGGFRAAARQGHLPETVDRLWWRGDVFDPPPGVPMNRAIATRRPVLVTDLAEEPSYRDGNTWIVAGVDQAGIRSMCTVPMLKDDEVIGIVSFYRREIRPFNEEQITLVQNFANQAGIAIENARLLSELRESLEQQTATAEVLKVISASPGELQPVFQATIDNATRLCGAKFGGLSFREGDVFRSMAIHGFRPAYLEERLRDPIIQPTPGHNLERLLRTRTTVHIPDLASDVEAARALFERAGARALLNVPLLKGDDVIGSIMIYRDEPGAFTDKQIALVQTFAEQAAIAIENARLLSELRQSLEQQTATADVLRVISASPGELEPVFQAMLENAVRICEAKFGNLLRMDGNVFHLAAGVGVPPALADFHSQHPAFQPVPGSPLDRAMRTKRVSHTADDAAAATPSPPARLGGARSIVCVPMLKDGAVSGAIVIYRQEVRPFTDKQIELLTNFAAQAVIAIENTRLLNELRESLEQQTATADILRVISSSPGDLEPVFSTMLENATRICQAEFGVLSLREGAALRVVAMHNPPTAYAELRRREPTWMPTGQMGHILAQAAAGKQAIQVPDLAAYSKDDPLIRDFSTTTGARSLIAVPLLKEGEVIGTSVIYRQEVRPFTDKQIELLTNFAAQAVIAIENTRLLNELRQRTADLSKSLEDLRTAQDRLVQSQKLASLGQLTAGIAHEIKNPLNFVNNFSSLSVELVDELNEALRQVQMDDRLRDDIAELSATLRGNMEKIVQHGKRADSIVKNMLLHSREGSGEHRAVDINAIVEEALNLAYHGARAEKQDFNITLERAFDPAAGEVDIYPQEVTRVLLNLITNGFYAAAKRKGENGDGGYEPLLLAVTKDLGDRVEIRIRDNGTGIPPEVKEKMFNPFFTTKPAGEGTGLGLSISHDIVVKQHSGTIEVDTRPGEFTEFRIVLPRAAAFPVPSGGKA
jgi:GAF domain-containing protein